MNDQYETQEQKLKSLFGTWPACAETFIADGTTWTIVDVDNSPDKMLEGSMITFSKPCEDKSGNGTVKPKLHAASNSAKPALAGQLATAWGAVELKYCKEYKALTGKLNIPDNDGHEHTHTVTIHISGANSASSKKPIIVCDYDDDVWNHSGSWKAQH